jgi:uncharacterized protein YukE
MNPRQIQHQIEAVKKQLAELGSMHSGSLSEQYNVCGNPGCRCKDPKDPQRHGPYYQLSYTWRGKSSTRFVRQEGVAKMREKVSNYKRFRELVNECVDLSLELEQAERAQAKDADGN